MFYIIQSYSVILLELMCCKIFFEIFCHTGEKRDFLWQILFWGGLSSAIFLTGICLGRYFIIKELVIIMLAGCMMKMYLGLTYKKSFILAVIYQGMVLVVDYITVIYDKSILTEIEAQNSVAQSLVIILAKIFVFLIVIVIRRYVGKRNVENLADAEWIKFLFFPAFSICIITALVSNISFITNEKQEELFLVFAVGLVGMNIMMFYLLQETAERERKLQENRIFEIETNNRLKLYESVSEAVEKQREQSHEYQNRIACIQALCRQGEYKKLEEYIEQINGTVQHDLDYINTNHAIANAVLNEKYREALEENIIMVCKINDLSRIQTADRDIALILSNIMNNAIEACRKCRGRKVIKLKCVHENENLIISVKNTYDGKLNEKDGVFLTTKENEKENHGIGIKNMVTVIEKCGGFYSVKHTEKEFYFSIILPQNETSR